MFRIVVAKRFSDIVNIDLLYLYVVGYYGPWIDNQKERFCEVKLLCNLLCNFVGDFDSLFRFS